MRNAVAWSLAEDAFARLRRLSRGSAAALALCSVVALLLLLCVDASRFGGGAGLMLIGVLGTGPASEDVGLRAFLGVLCRSGVVATYYPIAVFVFARRDGLGAFVPEAWRVLLSSIACSLSTWVVFVLVHVRALGALFLIALPLVCLIGLMWIADANSADERTMKRFISPYLQARLVAVLGHAALSASIGAAFSDTAVNAVSVVDYVLLLSHAACVAGVDVEIVSRLRGPSPENDPTEVFS